MRRRRKDQGRFGYIKILRKMVLNARAMSSTVQFRKVNGNVGGLQSYCSMSTRDSANGKIDAIKKHNTFI